MTWYASGPKIPPIDEKRVVQLYQRIQPVVRFTRVNGELTPSSEGGLRFIEPVDPFNQPFTVNPKPRGQATRKLRFVGNAVTYHTWCIFPELKPLVSEVLMQINADYLSFITAFETVTDVGPENIEGNYIRTITRLYAPKREG
ncbi:MAG: hypothetical protein PHD72_02925 [Patescibacteria group bacterium]|nr:hypothetical protein [Patescibacteria group bacterium]